MTGSEAYGTYVTDNQGAAALHETFMETCTQPFPLVLSSSPDQ